MSATTAAVHGLPAPLRVLVVQEQLPSYRVEFFRQLGARVALTVVYGPSGREEGFDIPGDHDLPPGPVWMRMEPRAVRVGRRSLVWFPGLLRRLAAMRPDVVIAAGNKRLIQNHLLIAGQLRWRYRLYFMQHARTYGARSWLFDLGETLYHRHYICRCSTGLILYTEAEKRALAGRGFPARKLSFTQNAIDTAGIGHLAGELSEEEAGRIRSGFGMGELPSVGFIGRLVEGKRVDVAIGYHQRLRAYVPQLQTVIIGDGPVSARVREWARTVPGVVWTGAVYDERVIAALLRGCRYVFCPGYAGLNVLHAFAHARPFVAFHSTEHKPEFSYLEDGRNGLVLDPSDPDGNVARLRRLIDDEPYWQRLSCGAAESASRLTVEGMVERVCRTLTVQPLEATTGSDQ